MTTKLSKAVSQHNDFWDALSKMPLAQKTISQESLTEVLAIIYNNKPIVKSALRFISKKEALLIRKNKFTILRRIMAQSTRQELKIIAKEFGKFMVWRDILTWNDVLNLIKSGFTEFRPYMLGVRFTENGSNLYPRTSIKTFCEQYNDTGINPLSPRFGHHGMTLGESNS